MSYGRLTRTKGPVRSQKPAHHGRITAHDFRTNKRDPQQLFKSENGRWVLANTGAETTEVEGMTE